jgi:hypothetical protein
MQAQADDEEETGSKSQAKGRTRTRRWLRRKVTCGKKIIYILLGEKNFPKSEKRI